MSETNDTPEVVAEVNTTEPAPVANKLAEPDDFDELSGEEAMALVKEAESTGKSMAEVKAAYKKKPKAEADTKSKEVDEPDESKPETKAKDDEPAETKPKKYKVKVDGKEEEVDEAELIKGYTYQKAANKRFQEGQTMRNQALEFLTDMKDENKLFDVIKKLGYDPRALSEKFLVEQLQEEMLTPEQKELKQYRKEIQIARAKEEADKKAAQEASDKIEVQRYLDQYKVEFPLAIKKAELSDTPEVVDRIAHYIKVAAKGKINMTTERAAFLVKEDLQKEFDNITKNMNEEQLYKFLGDEAAAKVLKARGKQVAKTTNYNHQEKSGNDNSHRKTREKAVKTYEDWKNYNGT